jgi:hypothetical protein
VFSTPAHPRTYFDFNNLPGGLPGAFLSPTGGVDYLTFDVNIASAEYSPPCYSYFDRCHITYNQRYTPHLLDTVPNQVVAGSKVNFWINTVETFSNFDSSYYPFYYVKLGKENCNLDGIITN